MTITIITLQAINPQLQNNNQHQAQPKERIKAGCQEDSSRGNGTTKQITKKKRKRKRKKKVMQEPMMQHSYNRHNPKSSPQHQTMQGNHKQLLPPPTRKAAGGLCSFGPYWKLSCGVSTRFPRSSGLHASETRSTTSHSRNTL